MIKQGVKSISVGSIQRQIGVLLLVWSALSICAGLLLIFLGIPFWRGVGLQGVVWGIIDAGIALFGLASSRRKGSRPDALTPTVLRREAKGLRRLLLVNVGLDVVYILAGIIVLLTFDTPFAHGNGVGILIQGGFLLLFDNFYATRVEVN